MKKKSRCILIIFALTAATAAFYVFAANHVNIETYEEISNPPKISPDYTSLVIPPNIAPLNFAINEPGKKYFVRIYTSAGQKIEIANTDSKIIIPPGKWQKLLTSNHGKKIFYDVFVLDQENNWQRYRTFSNKIANQNEPIDSHLVYRRLKPNFNWFRNIGIYQRNLENFDESVVIHGKSFGNSCVNCHTFVNNSPDSMIFGYRGPFGSDTMMVRNGTAGKIGTKLGYTTFHPGGKLVTSSINKVQQFFHFGGGMEVRDVLDLDSYITSYDIDKKIAKTDPRLTDKQQLETYPTWSPDGKYLYYCSADILWKNRNEISPEKYEKLKYDLMRIPYDIDTDQWGTPEMILSSQKTGLSILLPKVSPDNRYLIFSMCRYGCFPIYQPSSDLYMMDLSTKKYKKLDINSEFSESWHSFSTNSRWIVFSSKRQGGLFTRTYISYIDKNANAHKPFVLPQKDPAYYDTELETFSLPELITGPIQISKRKLTKEIRKQTNTKTDLPITSATPKSKTENPWRQ